MTLLASAFYPRPLTDASIPAHIKAEPALAKVLTNALAFVKCSSLSAAKENQFLLLNPNDTENFCFFKYDKHCLYFFIFSRPNPTKEEFIQDEKLLEVHPNEASPYRQKIIKMAGDIDETKSQAKKNIEKLIDRGEKIENILDSTDKWTESSFNNFSLQKKGAKQKWVASFSSCFSKLSLFSCFPKSRTTNHTDEELKEGLLAEYNKNNRA
jgi:hypothetical protein